MNKPPVFGVVPEGDAAGIKASLLRDTRDFVEPEDGSGLIGYVILTFYDDGSTQASSYRPKVEDHRMGSTMFEAWARSSLEHQLSMALAIRAAHMVNKGEA